MKIITKKVTDNTITLQFIIDLGNEQKIDITKILNVEDVINMLDGLGEAVHAHNNLEVNK